MVRLAATGQGGLCSGMVYLIPIVCLLVPLVVAMIAMQKNMRWVPVLFAAVCAVIMIWAIMKGQQAQGFDGIGYGIIAVLMAAPAIIGTLVGALIGWIRVRRAGAGSP